VAPEIAKAAPVIVTEFTVRAALPDDVRLRVLVEEVLRFTLPKSRVDEPTVNAAAVPVPVRLTMVVLPEEELLEMVMVPPAAPMTVGSKLT